MFLLSFSSFSVTSQKFFDGLSEVPLNITSSMPVPLKLLAEVSPMTHFKASTTLDLPHPLGPTMPVNPLSIGKDVNSGKDLKQFISICLNFITIIC